MKKGDWKRINDVLRKRNIHHDQVKHINCIRLHPKESPAQRMKKIEIAVKLYEEGKPFLTEAWTSDRKKRFDVLNLIDDIDYEITTDMKKEMSKSYVADKIIEV